MWRVKSFCPHVREMKSTLKKNSQNFTLETEIGYDGYLIYKKR